MRITIPGADFSARNLGNIKYSRNVLSKMGISSGATFNAFQTFLDAFEAAGFREEFDRAYLFGGAKASADRVDIISLLDGNSLNFPSDNAAYHTTDGLVLSESGSFNPNTPYAISNLQPFHMHSYTNSAETAAGDTPCLLGMRSNTGGNDFAAYLSIKGGAANLWKPVVALGTANAVSAREINAISTTYAGLVSGFRVGGTVNLLRDGSIKSTNTNQAEAVVNAPFTGYFGIGGFGSAAANLNNKSAARQRFAGWGHSAWTVEKETQLKSILDALEASI